jgi:ribonuclease J
MTQQDKPRMVPIRKSGTHSSPRPRGNSIPRGNSLQARYLKPRVQKEPGKPMKDFTTLNTTDRPVDKSFDSKDTVKIIALGGLGEVGRNMHLVEYQNQGIIIDLGLRFPEENMYGVDFIIPNIEYIMTNKNLKILGIIISHAHYDHLGAIPYLIDKLGYPPIYATPLSRDIVLKRQEDFTYLRKLDIRTIDKNDFKTINLGPFAIDAFHVNHNIPDSVGLFIATPMGNIIYSGDYKIDFNPVADKPADLASIVRLASRGVDLLMVDSTGVESEGHSMSEKEIFKNMEGIFEDATGRIIMATFASLVGRIQQAI